MSTPLRVADLEVLFTSNVDEETARAEKVIKSASDRIDKKPIKTKVDVDTKDAVDGMKDVEATAKRVVTAKTVATVDANIERAEKQFMRVYERLDYLRAVSPNLQVDADVKRAERELERTQARLEALRKTKAEITVDADTKPLEEKGDTAGASFFRKLDGATRGAGEKVGSTIGAGVEDSLMSALTAIPVAGGIILAGVAIGKAVIGGIQDGLQVEVRQDRLAALAGLDEADARRFAFSAGEAYANTFGDSVEQNMDTAKLGLQFGIIDEKATSRQAQRVIQSLSGISDVLDEDVKRSATTVSVLLKTGLAASADDAFDLLATGAREGLNRNEDLLDTLTEYPVVLRRLGLSGAESLGLLNQGLKAGARNTDVIADGLKEFQIRATDASESSADGFRRLGLDASEMTAKIARGGADAREGLQQVLQALRDTEDPVQRNAAAVELFGTKAEDLGEALFSLDLSTAVDQLDGVTGSAQKMFDTLNDNDATKLDQAQRNIEIGMQGIQGALAAGFSEPLAEAAEWVSQNRGPVLQFFLDLANGALDFAETATDGFGEFISGPLAEMTEGLAGLIDFFNGSEERPKELDDLADSMRDFKGTTDDALVSIEEARTKLNDFAEPAVKMGYLNDAAQRTAQSVANLGDQNGTLQSQVLASVDALKAELDAAVAAGEGQDDLQGRYDATRQALMDSLTQMDLTSDEAAALVEQFGLIPSLVTTRVTADTSEARAAIRGVITDYSGLRINLSVGAQGQQVYQREGSNVRYEARGDVLEFYRSGGLRGLTPMQPLAQMVPANTWRVVGDRVDVPELYAPLDGSPRSWSLLMEGLRRMPGVMPMADGGVLAAGSPVMAGGGSSPVIQFGDIIIRGEGLSVAEVLNLIRQEIREALRGRGGNG